MFEEFISVVFPKGGCSVGRVVLKCEMLSGEQTRFIRATARSHMIECAEIYACYLDRTAKIVKL